MTLADEINQMVVSILQASTWTSAGGANPVDNFISEARGLDTPDLEDIIRTLIEENQPAPKPTPAKEAAVPKTPELTPTRDTIIPKATESLIAKAPESPLDISKSISKLSKEDATGILSKAGLNPRNIPTLMALSSGRGGLQLLTRLGGVAGLTALLGPLAVGLAVQPVTEAVIKELQRPGGFLDKRVRIDAREEVFAGLERQTRQNTRIGDRQVIIQQFQGFRSFEGYASTNTSRLIRENADRVLDIGLFDRAQGLT